MKLTAIVLAILATLGSSFLPCHAQQVNAALTSEQRPGLAASAIPGRVSREQVQAILAAADQEGRQAFSDLVQQTTALPSTLLSIQEQARRWGHTSNPCMQKISSLEDRLGKSLQPKQVEDIVAMNQLLGRSDGSVVNVCRGVFQSHTNSDCFALFTSVSVAVGVEKQRQEQVENAKKAILDVEGALDEVDLSRANELYQRLATAVPLPHFAQNYLQQTQSLGLDLASYAQAVQLGHRHDIALLQQVENLSREVKMLNVSEPGRPLTKKYFQRAIKDDSESVRQQLASLATFQFDETPYRIPSGLSDDATFAFVSSHIKSIDDSLASISEARAIAAQPEAMKTIEEIVGGTEAAKLNATASQIAAAEHVRASLVDAQNSVQAKITAEAKACKEAEREQIAALETQKQAEQRKQAELVKAKARQESGALAPVKVGGRWGFVDMTGKIAIRPQFGIANEFSEGLAAVGEGGVMGGKWGFVDLKGRYVINPRFVSVFSFSEGVAAVEIGDKWGYIDKEGSFVIEPQFRVAAPFSEGLASVTIDKRGKMGFIDKTGAIVIEPQFLVAVGFSEGLAPAQLSFDYGSGWGYINKSGKFVIRPQLRYTEGFYEGLARTTTGPAGCDRNDSCRVAFIDKTGRTVIRPQFNAAKDFSEGLAPAYTEDGWGYINKTGKFVIRPQFAQAGMFSEGLAWVMTDSGKIGFIDKTGKIVINPQFEEAKDFSDPSRSLPLDR
jgi:WG containing repeat